MHRGFRLFDEYGKDKIMSFSKEWELIYKTNQHISVWPWSDLVSVFILRYQRLLKQGRSKSSIKVLELGCGAGANVPLFKELSVAYTGIDGSESMISKLKHKHPKLNFICADFTKNNLPGKEYDFIIDRASLTHNDSISIIRCLGNCYNLLNNGGYFIGIDWFSQKHFAFKYGEFIDPFTKSSKTEGIFAGLGNVHFSTESHLRDLFKKFYIEELSHKLIEHKGPITRHGTKLGSYQIISIKYD